MSTSSTSHRNAGQRAAERKAIAKYMDPAHHEHNLEAAIIISADPVKYPHSSGLGRWAAMVLAGTRQIGRAS